MVKRSPVGRMMGAIVPRAMDAIDPDELLERIDLDAALERLDLNALLARIDLQELLDRIDLAPVLERIDIDGIVRRVDVDAVVSQVDIDGLMSRVDIDALLGRIDLPALVARAGIDQIVRDATSGIATSTLDLGRRQVLGIDVVAMGLVDRMLRRRPPLGADALTQDGRRLGGPLARVLAFLVDSVAVSATFGLLVALGTTLAGLFTGHTVRATRGGGPIWFAAYLTWWFAYLWLSVAITGRTVGKGLLGLKVAGLDGELVAPGRAAIRALLLPVSLVFGIGFLPALFGRSRRAFHDLVAGSRVEVDWGERSVELPAALRSWQARVDEPGT